tara:strand:+ start:37 stop:897 length:861 start_codon:yes stop_codon:yes gene_type:complete
MGINFNDVTVADLDDTDLGQMPSNLCLLKTKVSEAFRGVSFAKMGGNRLWVYYPDEPYPMGYIGYGDFRTETVGDDQYIVGSRTIINDKYGSYQDQHNMKMTVNVETAIRNAKRFLRNFSPQEMAKSKLRTVCSQSQDSLGDISTEYRNKMRELFDHESRNTNKMLTELRNLVDTGHEFVDAAFGSELRAMFELSDNEKALKDKPIHMYFVRVSEKFGKQTFDVGTIDNVQKSSYHVEMSNEFKRYTDDLPEEIMGKLSVLTMVENDSYVDDVGYRAAEGMFYVVR